MRIVIQRVKNASVEVQEKEVGRIDKGILVLLGITHGDTEKDIDYLIKKIFNLRIFSDENDKMNLSLKDVKGELLIVSQFTLYGECKKGLRPSYSNAAKSDIAEELYEKFIIKAKKENIKVEKGIFGANMKVSLLNDGPVTLILDSDHKK